MNNDYQLNLLGGMLIDPELKSELIFSVTLRMTMRVSIERYG